MDKLNTSLYTTENPVKDALALENIAKIAKLP